MERFFGLSFWISQICKNIILPDFLAYALICMFLFKLLCRPYNLHNSMLKIHHKININSKRETRKFYQICPLDNCHLVRNLNQMKLILNFLQNHLKNAYEASIWADFNLIHSLIKNDSWSKKFSNSKCNISNSAIVCKEKGFLFLFVNVWYNKCKPNITTNNIDFIICSDLPFINHLMVNCTCGMRSLNTIFQEMLR